MNNLKDYGNYIRFLIVDSRTIRTKLAAFFGRLLFKPFSFPIKTLESKFKAKSLNVFKEILCLAGHDGRGPPEGLSQDAGPGRRDPRPPQHQEVDRHQAPDPHVDLPRGKD